MTDARGCPEAVTVHEGNVSDSQTFLPEVERLRKEFGIEDGVRVSGISPSHASRKPSRPKRHWTAFMSFARTGRPSPWRRPSACVNIKP
jgi:hypothetical protein